MTSQPPRRVWMITGASRGLGAAIARAALERGDAVVATGRSVDSVMKAHGDHPNLLAAALDVTREEQASHAVGAALQRFGSVDVLVNNAGHGLLGAVEEASAEEVRRVYETNVFGLLNVTRAVLPNMRKRRRGHVVNFSSVGGIRASAGFGVYCSTKFAVEGLSEALHAELSPLGIHVTVIQPGYFRTDFLDPSSLATSSRIIDDYAATAGRVRDAATRISHNQPGDPQRLAQAILQLADADSPPVHLPLGTDSLRALDDKLDRVARETQEWRKLASSTDF